MQKDQIDNVETGEVDRQQLATTTRSQGSNKKAFSVWHLMAALAVVCIVVVPTTLVTTLRDDYEDDNNNNNKDVPEDRTPTYDTDSIESFELVDGPFNASIPYFSANVMKGYNDEEELKEGLWNVSWLLLSNVVNRNTYKAGFESAGRGQMNPNMEEIMLDSGFEQDESMPAPARDESSANKNAVGDVDDFGTNNQEQGVEEGDIIVTDGVRAYAAYGDHIVVWDVRDGSIVTTVRMPTMSNEKKEEPNEVQEKSAFGSSIMYDYQPSANIRSLMLRENRLLVVVDGYGYYHRVQYGASNDREFPILYDYLSTHLRVYDTASLDQDPLDGGSPTLALLSSGDINGAFNELRAVGDNVHIVTSSGIDTYTDLIQPFHKMNFPKNMTDEEYARSVRDIAKTEYIPKFVKALTDELDDGAVAAFPNFIRINMWQTNVTDKLQGQLAFGDGVVNSVTQVFSFNIASLTVGQELELSAAGAFLPTYWSQVYASADTLILASQGWQPDVGESTYLIAMKLKDATSTPRAIGHLPGYVLNKHFIDVKDNVLRIATSIRRRPFFIGIPVDVVVDVDDPIEPRESSVAESGGDSDANEQEVSPLDDEEREPIKEEEKEEETAGSELKPLPLPEPRPITDETDPDENNTENYIVLLDLGPALEDNEDDDDDDDTDDVASSQVMQELGRVQLGKPNELFTAVRFFDNIAYAVTFERTDPLYVLDLTDPTNPTVLAALEITGFSSYLHSMNQDNSLLLSIGHEADAVTGREVGLQVTVFDMATPTDPRVVKRHLIFNNTDVGGWSYSDALSDFKAVRYSMEAERLIIPVDINSWEHPELSFSGFMVFRANQDTVEEMSDCRVVHRYGNTYERGCHSCGWLPPRSMIIDGDLMTTYGHTLASTNLDDCELKWNTTIEVEEGMCCGYYYLE